MRRGEVWWVSFARSSGGEVRKTRPAVIVSNDAANRHANRVQVVPLSSKTDKLFPCEASVTVEGRESKAMADQIMTVSNERLTDRLGLLSPDEMCVALKWLCASSLAWPPDARYNSLGVDERITGQQDVAA